MTYPLGVRPRPASSRSRNNRVFSILALLACLFWSQSASAYSVLTHEQIVDLLWKSQIRPMLLERFPASTEAQLKQAHAYAYGGCLIQDIGYYPFGNHLFSDLTHYVRSGDFVTTLIADALDDKDLNEYAFALGALAHYASDIAGHPAVNLAAAVYFPKLEARYGKIVTYADNPTDHIRTEFGFDVDQVAQDHFTSQAFHDFIGFEVSTPLLEHAFAQTYGLPLDTVFPNLDLAIGTFRYSVSQVIPRLTRVAIVMKKDEILKQDPTMTRKRYVYRLKTSQYRREWGRTYRGPSFGDRLLAFLLSILPKIGPLRSLDVKMPTPFTEKLYLDSVDTAVQLYGQELSQTAAHTLRLANMDFDTGNATHAGEYSLTDETYANLLLKLADNHFAQATPELKANLLDFYTDPKPPAFAAKDPHKWSATLNGLAQLQTFATPASR